MSRFSKLKSCYIFVLTESKLDDADNELIENEFKNIGFTCYIKNRKSLSVKSSGGIIVSIKKI